MKTISLWQPWASAIALGLKTYETRKRFASYRGPIAIHAAKTKNRELVDAFHQLLVRRDVCAAFHAAGFYTFESLPLGAIVAVASLEGCTLTEIVSPHITHLERALGDYTPGRCAWSLARVRPLREPLPWRGCQSFFDVPDNVIQPYIAAT